jgi:hypothetical protein
MARWAIARAFFNGGSLGAAGISTQRAEPS